MDGGEADGGDVTPPHVLGTSPTNTVGVPAYAAFQLIVFFSEPMDTQQFVATVSPNDSTLEFNAFQWSMNDTQVVLVSDLGPTSWNTSYSITLNGRDLAGNAMSPLSVSLSSEVQGAAITSWTPGDAMPAAPTDQLSFTFAAAMNPGSVSVEAVDINAGSSFWGAQPGATAT